ncbi:hypothetical protein FACS189425_01580 [Clostridia bacterium]|nr:hypothetical protein FACS189425_01580 [Clostridia bacterium]
MITFSFNKLRYKLIERKMSNTDLLRMTGINSATLAKIRKNEPVKLQILGRICEVLDCDIGDILEIIKSELANEQIYTGGYATLKDPTQSVRYKVFVCEQGISPQIEQDKYDESATHTIVYVNNKPVATGRIAEVDGKWYIGRVAVLKECRGLHLGNSVVKALIEWAATQNIEEIYIHAQAYVEIFYKKLGFETFGESFEEAGISHVNMVYKIKGE